MGAITVADGADVAQGHKADVVWAGGPGSVISILKALVPQYSTEMDYDVNGNVIYYGIAEPGSNVSASAWQIRRLDYNVSGNLSDMVFANGLRTFNQAWINRLALSYS